MLRKTLCRLLCCIAILCLLGTSVLASEGEPQHPQTGSLSFDFSAASTPVTGGVLELRQVAVADPDAKTLTLCAPFADAGVSVEALTEDEGAAAKLFLYAETKGLAAEQLEIGEDGKASFPDAALGIWLVSQTEPFDGYDCMLPALISVPLRVGEALIYDVDASPKLTPPQENTEPSTEPLIPPPLPQTGQTNWPVPLLALGGSMLVLFGLLLRKEKRHETKA